MKGILRQASEIYVLKEEFKNNISQKENKVVSSKKTAISNEKNDAEESKKLETSAL